MPDEVSTAVLASDPGYNTPMAELVLAILDRERLRCRSVETRARE